jgi:hypothetical protein
VKNIFYVTNALLFLITYSAWRYLVRTSGYPWHINLLGIVFILVIYTVVCFCIGKLGDKR